MNTRNYFKDIILFNHCNVKAIIIFDIYREIPLSRSKTLLDAWQKTKLSKAQPREPSEVNATTTSKDYS